MPAGRPTKYNPAFCETVIELGKMGKGPAQIASALGVARKSLWDWAEAHPEFSAALTRAKDEEQTWWENIAQDALFADKFNSAVWSKSMSARFRDEYTERRDVNNKHEVSDPLTEVLKEVANAGKRIGK